MTELGTAEASPLGNAGKPPGLALLLSLACVACGGAPSAHSVVPDQASAASEPEPTTEREPAAEPVAEAEPPPSGGGATALLEPDPTHIHIPNLGEAWHCNAAVDESAGGGLNARWDCRRSVDNVRTQLLAREYSFRAEFREPADVLSREPYRRNWNKVMGPLDVVSEQWVPWGESRAFECLLRNPSDGRPFAVRERVANVENHVILVSGASFSPADPEVVRAMELWFESTRFDNLHPAASPAPAPVAGECPHSAPTDGTPCTPPGAAACTYPGPDRTCTRVIATCRDRRWHVDCLPPGK